MKQEIEILIDELVLHGFSRGDGENIKAAVEAELSRLFTEQGLPGTVNASAKYGLINGTNFPLTTSAKAHAIGNNIAGAVYNGIKDPGFKNK